MNLFLGDKNEIGVELQNVKRDEANNVVGFGKIWLGGHFLGTIQDHIYMDGYLLGGLFQILKVPFINTLILNNNTETHGYFNELYERLNDDNDLEIHRYLMGFGTFTDMFYVFAYKKDENIFIEWKIDEDANNTIFSDLIDYPSSFFLYKIEYVKFKEFIERLDRIIANW